MTVSSVYRVLIFFVYQPTPRNTTDNQREDLGRLGANRPLFLRDAMSTKKTNRKISTEVMGARHWKTRRVPYE